MIYTPKRNMDYYRHIKTSLRLPLPLARSQNQQRTHLSSERQDTKVSISLDYMDSIKKILFSQEYQTFPANPEGEYQQACSPGKKKILCSAPGTQESQSKYICNICDVAFTENRKLGVHLKSHNKANVYKCDACGNQYSTQGHLNDHLRSHTNQRPYKCSQCDKAFRRSSTLRIHEKIHSNIKSYLCHVCGKGFVQSGNLITHMRKHVLS
jgi:uncharacterized Zn-finger protein